MKNMKLLLNFFFFFAVLSVISTYGQTVTISNLRYTNGALIPNGSAIEIYEGGSKSVTFDLKIDNPQSLSVRGNLYVMSKKSSSASSSLQYLNVDFTNNNLSSWYSKEFTISLNATNFSATGGRLYGQFNVTSSSGGVITGNIIPIKVIPSPIPPEMIFIGGPGGTTSTIINEGDTSPVISGTGKGNYTYQWYQSINGYVTPISGATNFYYYPGTPFVTTKYFRENKLGSVIVNSNEITITVINNAPPISNNTITTRDDGIFIGNGLPTGGLGGNSYRYDWFITDEDGESVKLYSEASEYVSFTQSKFDYFRKSASNFKISRLVYSGSQVSISNDVDIPHFSDIQNNIISLNGHYVTGSVPTGGIGDYTYSWALLSPGTYIELDETTKDLDLTSHPNFFDGTPLIRIVTAGISSTSNKLALIAITAKAFNKENTVVSAVYPNPTSGSINFTTDLSSNKEIEIIVYSEKLKNTQSVFKGTATPNQIVKWDIPSNYPKGTYYYKIVSDNKEVKSGKILYQ
jgi:hypothetical protein